MVDVPSQKAPGGAKGKRVILTRKAAEAALPSLIGMALDYSPQFDGHDARRKVGVITDADVVGQNLEIGGYLYAKDFPEIVEEVEKFGGRGDGRLRTSDLGLQTSDCRPRTSDLGPQVMRFTPQAEGKELRGVLSVAVREIRSLVASGAGRNTARKSPLTLRAEAGGGIGKALGMSFEATNVDVVDKRARIWILSQLTFTGAAILRRDRAAYRDTWIELVP